MTFASPLSNTTVLLQKINTQIQDLPEESLRELARYVRFLRYKAKTRQTKTRMPTADDPELAHARALMRELGRGLGAGQAPHDAARNHDAYLYARGRR